jgi:dihydropteroate synthase
MPRKLYTWKLKDREIRLGERTLIVGVLNITPDSFSDGGRYEDPDRAYARAIEMEEAGADIIDIGAESTKPGSARISAAEELRRLIPVLKRLKGALSIPISVDTYKAEVATLAIEHGAEIINDPSGFTFDPLLAKVVVDNDAGLILNHMRGTPETWDKLPPLPDVMGAVTKDLDASANRARRSGVDKSRIVLDPGLGFGKRKEQNAEILARLGELAKLDYPVLTGPSKKSFLMQSGDQETLFATAAAVAASVLGGAHLVRVHDIKEMRAVIQVAEEIARAVPAIEEEAAPVRPKPATRKPMGASPEITETEKPPSMRPPLRKPEPRKVEPPAAPREEAERERPAAKPYERKPYERKERAPERSFERRPPRQSDGPRDGSRPPRKFGPPSDSRGDRPFTPRRSDGPPRRSEGPPRKFGPPSDSRGPRKFGPPSDSRGDRPFTPRRSDGPPRRSDGPPRKFGPPSDSRGDRPFTPRRSDGPPRRSDGPPRKFGPPSNAGSKDRPYPPRRPGGPGGGFKRPPAKGGPPRRPRPDSK